MKQSSLAFILIIFSFSIFANSFEEKANEIFEKRFSENKIKGLGHIFWLVIECDNERLSKIIKTLKKGEIKIIEYDFMFNINTKNIKKTNITHSTLNETLKNCIINKYHKNVFFTPFSPKLMKEHISFPVALSKGSEPIAPRTPVYSITHGE